MELARGTHFLARALLETDGVPLTTSLEMGRMTIAAACNPSAIHAGAPRCSRCAVRTNVFLRSSWGSRCWHRICERLTMAIDRWLPNR
jgi:hypothetical protein